MAMMRSAPAERGTTTVTGGTGWRGGRVALSALIWTTSYSALRVYWQVTGEPGEMSPIGDDLVAFTGWGAVILCGLAAITAGGLAWAGRACSGITGPVRRMLLAAGWTTSLGLVASGAMLLLDIVGGVLPGLGVEFYPRGALSRVTCVGGGAMLAVATWSLQGRTGARCRDCGRSWAAMRALPRTPRWAFGMAYVAVLGFLVRLVAQLVVGLNESPLTTGMSLLLFEFGFVLAGTLLPLALVHRWGRIWPRWAVGLAGRRVPRWLVLGPAAGIAGGLVIYFGLLLGQMTVARLNGRNPFPPSGGLDLPEAFFWFAVPAYLVWGIGVAAAALAYFRRTRRPCPTCTSP
ncbi:hypothetical protein [Phytoactinopolyspora halotolerans]|uniref:DUF3995 domain-containing protein n=1 Tax=Phytoactinopolyspora halotolerans TaxID=1981512 RepID=A0A6L9SD62_9ACTN|nr:hypothetical protein [Phytoactinopolyspora halotolerans]NEE01950.1 hypothetical protein [Phytoactinopolyspora halotolerans]